MICMSIYRERGGENCTRRVFQWVSNATLRWDATPGKEKGSWNPHQRIYCWGPPQNTKWIRMPSKHFQMTPKDTCKRKKHNGSEKVDGIFARPLNSVCFRNIEPSSSNVPDHPEIHQKGDPQSSRRFRHREIKDGCQHEAKVPLPRHPTYQKNKKITSDLQTPHLAFKARPVSPQNIGLQQNDLHGFPV